MGVHMFGGSYLCVRVNLKKQFELTGIWSHFGDHTVDFAFIAF